MAIKSIREIKMRKLFEHQRRLKKSKIVTFVQSLIARRLYLLVTVWNPAANLFQGCQTNLKDGLAENNSHCCDRGRDTVTHLPTEE